MLETNKEQAPSNYSLSIFDDVGSQLFVLPSGRTHGKHFLYLTACNNNFQAINSFHQSPCSRYCVLDDHMTTDVECT